MNSMKRLVLILVLSSLSPQALWSATTVTTCTKGKWVTTIAGTTTAPAGAKVKIINAGLDVTPGNPVVSGGKFHIQYSNVGTTTPQPGQTVTIQIAGCPDVKATIGIGSALKNGCGICDPTFSFDPVPLPLVNPVTRSASFSDGLTEIIFDPGLAALLGTESVSFGQSGSLDMLFEPSPLVPGEIWVTFNNPVIAIEEIVLPGGISCGIPEMPFNLTTIEGYSAGPIVWDPETKVFGGNWVQSIATSCFSFGPQIFTVTGTMDPELGTAYLSAIAEEQRSLQFSGSHGIPSLSGCGFIAFTLLLLILGATLLHRRTIIDNF